MSIEQSVLARIETARARPSRLRDQFVTSAHGAGGKASAALVDAVFIDAFGQPGPELTDGAVFEVPQGRMAFSTDTYVVNPLHFKGGSIGDLAVNGTVNDLAVSGAKPKWLSAAFVLEEGFGIDELRAIVADMRRAADVAHISIVTGDTKVVPKGSADKVFINTAGIGVVPEGRHLGASQVLSDDVVVLSGDIGSHGMAVMMARGELAIDADITSD
ncbi:MAG: AIR synthase related protein, partial [Propionibacteriaceae bacterium]|nr:AIR synthase related protein [Propionibacteriaceae bacterium]